MKACPPEISSVKARDSGGQDLQSHWNRDFNTHEIGTCFRSASAGQYTGIARVALPMWCQADTATPLLPTGFGWEAIHSGLADAMRVHICNCPTNTPATIAPN